MKHSELVESDVIRKNFGPGHRITKQLTALRKRDEDAYPAGKKGYLANEVTAMEAARLMLVLSNNPNPFNSQEFDKAFNSIEILDGFLHDFAWILDAQGISLHGERVIAVFISLDRPFAKIILGGKSEQTYGDDGTFKGIERFAVITSPTLQEYAYLIKKAPKVGTDEQRKDFLNQISNTKI